MYVSYGKVSIFIYYATQHKVQLMSEVLCMGSDPGPSSIKLASTLKVSYTVMLYVHLGIY